MRKTVHLIVIAVLIALIAGPAAADHIVEPSAPITATELLLYKYPDRTTMLACDGTDVVTFDNMRIESRVTATAAPSEHFRERLTVYQVENPGTRIERIRYIWSVDWKHSNIPPHGPRLWESHQSNQRLDDHTGQTLIVEDVITGDVTGAQFISTCRFLVG